MPHVRFENAVSKADLALLRRLGLASEQAGAKLWAVGGVVRDALLGLPIVDIDLTSETPADELGPALASALDGSCAKLTTFGTLKLTIADRIFDLASARAETYTQPY